MSLWRKKLVLHSNLAGVSNGQIQNPIIGSIIPSSTNLPASTSGLDGLKEKEMILLKYSVSKSEADVFVGYNLTQPTAGKSLR